MSVAPAPAPPPLAEFRDPLIYCTDCASRLVVDDVGRLECPQCDQVPPPLLREISWALDLAALAYAPVYYGLGVPRGRGQPVLTLPGFLGGDSYLLVLRDWLWRLGYRALASGITVNIDCPNLALRGLIARAEATVERTGQRLTVIGHSKGGYMARVLGLLRPDLVRHVIALGAPYAASPRTGHPLVISLVELTKALRLAGTDDPHAYRADCYFHTCPCEFGQAQARPWPESVAFTAIYSRDDGVVRWRNCQDHRVASNNLEVAGSHIGLVFNASVYRHLGRLLAEADRAR